MFNGFDILKLKDDNQQDHFTSHFAEVVATHLYHKKSQKAAKANMGAPVKELVYYFCCSIIHSIYTPYAFFTVHFQNFFFFYKISKKKRINLVNF